MLLNPYSRSGISNGDIAFIPTFGDGYPVATVNNATSQQIAYKCGVLLKAPFGTIEIKRASADLGIHNYEMLSDVDNGGGFRLIAITTTGTELTVNSKMFTVETATRYDILFFGNSTVPVFYIIKVSDGTLVHSYILSGNQAPNVSGATVEFTKHGASKEYRICHNSFSEIDAGYNEGTGTDFVRISRDGTKWWRGRARVLSVSTDEGLTWTDLYTFPVNGNILFIHETATGALLVKPSGGSGLPLMRSTNAEHTAFANTNLNLGVYGEMQMWASAITERTTPGSRVLWACHYSTSPDPDTVVLWKSTDDGITWTASVNAAHIFGEDITHIENIMYNPYEETLHMNVGESVDLGPVVAVAPWNFTSYTDWDVATVSPYADWGMSGGFYRGAFLADGSFIHGSDSNSGSFLARDVKTGADWDMEAGYPLPGRFDGFGSCSTTLVGGGIYCSGANILLVDGRNPVVLWEGTAVTGQPYPFSNSDYQGDVLVFNDQKYVFENYLLNAEEYSSFNLFDLETEVVESAEEQTIALDTGRTVSGVQTELSDTDRSIISSDSLNADTARMNTFNLSAESDAYRVINKLDGAESDTSRETRSNQSQLADTKRSINDQNTFTPDTVRITRELVGRTNLILNPSFELRSGNDLLNWTETQLGSSTVTADTSTLSQTAAKLSVDSSNSLVGITTTNNVAVLPNTEYTLELWARSDTAGLMEIQVGDIIATSGRRMLQVDGSWSTAVNRFTINTTIEWTKWTKTFRTAPDQSTFAISDLKRTGIGASQANRTFWVDEVKLVESGGRELNVDTNRQLTISVAAELDTDRTINKLSTFLGDAERVTRLLSSLEADTVRVVLQTDLIDISIDTNRSIIIRRDVSLDTDRVVEELESILTEVNRIILNIESTDADTLRTLKSISKSILVWDGSDWVPKYVLRWTGTEWELVNLKFFDGDAWRVMQ